MADRIENNLPAQSDAAYVRALDNSGNPIRISKADLAQVVAELIGRGSLTKGGLIYGWAATSGINWNKIIECEASSFIGIYMYGLVGTFSNQICIPLYLRVQRYDGDNVKIFAEKLTSLTINVDYGVKIKYKITSDRVKVWLFGWYSFLSVGNGSLISGLPVVEEPENDAVDLTIIG